MLSGRLYVKGRWEKMDHGRQEGPIRARDGKRRWGPITNGNIRT
jgi:hypothetical protein